MQFGHHFDGWNYGWLGVPAMRARANESVIPAAEREAFMARYKAPPAWPSRRWTRRRRRSRPAERARLKP